MFAQIWFSVLVIILSVIASAFGTLAKDSAKDISEPCCIGDLVPSHSCSNVLTVSDMKSKDGDFYVPRRLASRAQDLLESRKAVALELPGFASDFHGQVQRNELVDGIEPSSTNPQRSHVFERQVGSDLPRAASTNTSIRLRTDLLREKCKPFHPNSSERRKYRPWLIVT